MAIFKRLIQICIAKLFAIFLIIATGCSQLYFHPETALLGTPDEIDLTYEPIIVQQQNRELAGWYLPASTTYSGSLLFYHGNAGNISYHLGFVHWLPAAGYDVYLYDYQGYGESSGSVSIDKAVSDVLVMLEHTQTHIKQQHQTNYRLSLYGHSLGGSLLASALPQAQATGLLAEVDNIVIDSSFSDYRLIAREKMQQLWLTRYLRWPLGWLFPAQPKPVEDVKALQTMPLLIMHSPEDQVVPFNHGQALFDAATTSTKYFYPLADPRHNHGFQYPEDRLVFLKFLQSSQIRTTLNAQ